MTAVRVPYLGRLGALQKLPSPTEGMSSVPSMGGTAQPLLSGGTSVSSRLNSKTTYTLPYTLLPSVDADVILGFYRKLFGLGPYAFVDPTVRNVLSLDVSTCGARTQAAHGWAATSGAFTRTGTPPTGLTASGVLQWAGFTSGGIINPAVDVLATPPSVPLEACTASVWVKASASTSMTLRLSGYDATGTLLATGPTTAFTATTTWQVVSVTAVAGDSSLAASALLVPRLVANATATSVSIAAAQLEYSNTPTTWQPGFGSPRVLISQVPGREVPVLGSSSHTITLVQV
jgi:hypothetical protein